MAVTREVLRKEIHEILKDADLSKTSARKVRQQVEEKLDCDLTDRKKEIDELVMEFINDKSDDEDEEEEEEESDASVEEKPAKRPSSAKKPATKKKRHDSDSASEDGSDDDYKPSKGKSGGKKKKKGSDSDSDDDYKPKKAAKKSSGGGKGGGRGFTRPLQLSPELASLMGSEVLPRHEVVKKVWAMIKERNLYDPKNKQFAICDADLLKVIGVKRFRTFGMMKYLQPHFIG
uniref:CSON000755 protein n=1 Tax=Culicoides sonorensis TaxID=179676 RepID=A0A336KAK9_CULSO